MSISFLLAGLCPVGVVTAIEEVGVVTGAIEMGISDASSSGLINEDDVDESLTATGSMRPPSNESSINKGVCSVRDTEIGEGTFLLGIL